MRRHHLLVGFVALALVACDKDKSNASSTSSGAAPSASASTKPQASASASAAADSHDAGEAIDPQKPIVWKGFSTPESVLYDETQDRYLVSNIDGTPVAADGKGFISTLNPDGSTGELKWIESGKNKVTLNAPKGMALSGDLLYVADLDTVRTFNRMTGEPKDAIKVPGATFLNDMVAGNDGKVYVSDTGMKGGAKGFEPTGTDAVWVIGKDKKPSVVAKSKDLGGPNGLTIVSDKVWVVTFGSGELFAIDEAPDGGTKASAEKLPKGQLDGILALPGGEFAVSSWESSSIFRGKPGAWKEIVTNVKSPADIGFDSKRHRVLVPLFMDNEVRAYTMSVAAKPTQQP